MVARQAKRKAAASNSTAPKRQRQAAPELPPLVVAALGSCGGMPVVPVPSGEACYKTARAAATACIQTSAVPHLQACQLILRSCTAGRQRLYSRLPNTSQEWTQVRPHCQPLCVSLQMQSSCKPVCPIIAPALLAAALAALIEEHGVPDQPPKGLMPKGFTNLFHTLSKTILYQQLAGKAASTIHARFMGLIKVSTPAACPLLPLAATQRHSVNCMATAEALPQAAQRRSSA